MKCAEVEVLLVDDVRGELEAGLAAQVKEHVEGCASCRAQREELAGTVGLLAEGFKAAGKKPLRLDDLHRGRILLSRNRKIGVAGWMLRAAGLVVVLGGLAGLLIPAGVPYRCPKGSGAPAMAMMECASPAVDAIDFEKAEADKQEGGRPPPPESGPGDRSYSYGGKTRGGRSPEWRDDNGIVMHKKMIRRDVTEDSTQGGEGSAISLSVAKVDHEPAKAMLPPSPTLAPEAPTANRVALRSLVGEAETVNRKVRKAPESKGGARERSDRLEVGHGMGRGESAKDGAIMGKVAEARPGESSGLPMEAGRMGAGGGGVNGGNLNRLTLRANKLKTAVVTEDSRTERLAADMWGGALATVGGTAKEAAMPGGKTLEEPAAAAASAPVSTRESDELASKGFGGVASGMAGRDEKKSYMTADTIDAKPLVMKGLYANRAKQVDEVKGEKSEVQLFNRDIERSSGSALAERNEESAQFSDSDGLEDVVSSESRDKDGEGVESKIEEPVVYNAIVDVAANRFSTFSIDVDTASFAMVRRALLSGKVPSAGSARVEEFVNAFDQDYRPPEKRTFAVYTDRARSPFRAGVELMRIGVRGKVLGRDQQKASVLTLVVDTSGSMNTPDRIGLIKQGIRMLVSGLGPQDQLAIVTFGAKASLALDMTPATDKKAILAAVDGMETQGATHLEGGIRLGYEMASRHFGSGCLNRVVLMSDGVANLGAATADEILKQVEVYRKQGVFCSVYGFGQGTYNDAMLGALADKGDGVYRFIDSTAEAKRAFTEDLSAAFQVIARDVKIQVEFDPRRVKSYRQLGYEKRQLTAEQFRDDRVDAGEVGSGQSATALYDVEVTGNPDEPLGTVRIRWRDENSGQVEELAEPIRASDRYSDFGVAPTRFRLTAGAAELAGVLRGDPISKVTALGDIAVVLRPVGMELSLDRQVQDLVKMVTAARRLMK